MKINFPNIIILSIVISSASIAQNEWEKWGKAEINYELLAKSQNSYSLNTKSMGSFILSSLSVTYSFFISELDGDNCPFYPSCSEFFIESVRETNLFKGSLMFADRFVRDTNIFKRHPYYPLHSSGRLYDPIDNYKLEMNKIKLYPRDTVVK